MLPSLFTARTAPSPLADRVAADVSTRYSRLRARSESGAETTEWIFIVVGALVIGGVIVAAVTAFVQEQIAQLPGAE